MAEEQKKFKIPDSWPKLPRHFEKKEPDIRDISIAIDTYDDIFSDFDPRPYEERELSVDFMREMNRRFTEKKTGRLEVRFFLYGKDRDQKAEGIIKHRLREYFTLKRHELEKKVSSRRNSGVVYTGIGLVLLLCASISTQIFPVNISTQVSHTTFFIAALLQTLLVPAGWYGMFTGIERIVELPEETKMQLEMDRRLHDAEFIFLSNFELAKPVVSPSTKPS